MTDNWRLCEAKRRSAELNRLGAKLPRGSPRETVLYRMASRVQGRVLAASLVPMAVLLGPMVMTYLWFPARMDKAAWNAAPGTSVTILAAVDSDVRTPVQVAVNPPLTVDQVSALKQQLKPIRETLEKLQRQFQTPSNLTTQPWEMQLAGRELREMRLESLSAFLKQELPPQMVSWRIHAEKDAAGRFPVTVFTDTGTPVRVDVVLGDKFPPAPTQVPGDSLSPIRSVTVTYDKPDKPRVLWLPMAFAGINWEAGWLTIYLLSYLPVMFAARWGLRIA